MVNRTDKPAATTSTTKLICVSRIANRGSGRGALFRSPHAFILITWLICGLLPFTQAAGIGSKDVITNSPSLSHGEGASSLSPSFTPALENSSPARTVYDSDSDSSSHLESSDVPTTFHYNCPTSCQCEYSSSSQKLEIRCSSMTVTRSNEGTSSSSLPRTTTNRLDLSPGVRTLRMSHVLLDAKSVESVLGPLVIRRNTLVELDLEQVSIEPKSVFTCSLLRESAESLRKISIRRGTVRGDALTDYSASNVRGLLAPLASLQSMDSLIICDSSPSLATIVLQALPAVKHLRAANNSLYDIPYESLTSPHQYLIQSLDFSRNHLALIPTGLLEELGELRTLDVSHNRIFHLQEQVFTGLRSLRKLNVSHNRIEYVDAEVFTPLQAIQTVDLSDNEVVQFFEPYFANNKRLETLNMSNMWVSGTFTRTDTARRSLMETEQLIHTLLRLETLDISANGMTTLPETLTHAPNLLHVFLEGNRWECTCHDRWFLDWIATTKVAIGYKNSTGNLWCYSRREHGEASERYPLHDYLTNLSKTCTNQNIIARTPYKFHAVMGNDKQLKCHAQNPHWPKITWITPSKKHVAFTGGSATTGSSKSLPQLETSWVRRPPEPRVSADGSLHLSNVTGVDYGLYLCIASYEDLNITHYVHLGMDVSVFRDVRVMSIIVGWAFSFSFLAIVLLVQLVRCILDRLGVRCVSVNTSQQTRRVRAFFDSMEQHKNSQLDWLRDNYNMQAKKIKDNCYSQLDRIRESYANQSKNLGEIRDYGTQQFLTLRDQYNDQVRRVANYSAHQLCKVRENYVFKRNQVCQFSSHQLLRLRETYKWQAQTLNKILENLPRGLNFDTCRGMGACGRTDSIYLDDMGDEFGGPLTVDAEVYRLGLNHHKRSHSDKMEHVSLLIPPEFVAEYNIRAASVANVGIDNGSLLCSENDCERSPPTETAPAEDEEQVGIEPATTLEDQHISDVSTASSSCGETGTTPTTATLSSEPSSTDSCIAGPSSSTTATNVTISSPTRPQPCTSTEPEPTIGIITSTTATAELEKQAEV